MSGAVTVLTKDSAFGELATLLLEEAGFSVKVEAVFSGGDCVLADMDTADLPSGVKAVTVSRDPFLVCDLPRPFYNTRLVTLCLERFAALTGVDAYARLPASLLFVNRVHKGEGKAPEEKNATEEKNAPEEKKAPEEKNAPEKKNATEEELSLTDDGAVFCGERVTLTPVEYKLFACLFASRGKAVGEKTLLSLLGGDRNKLTVYINHLRDKLDRRFDKRMIVTVRKIGYMLK